jgi:putative component of toxin-antitoxin plasmid stabilization module
LVCGGWSLKRCSHVATLSLVPQIRKTEVFAKWIDGLRDLRARARVQVRIDYGPGYRVYFTKLGRDVVVLA